LEAALFRLSAAQARAEAARVAGTRNSWRTVLARGVFASEASECGTSPDPRSSFSTRRAYDSRSWRTSATFGRIE